MEKLAAGDLIQFIGLCIAAFALLATYPNLVKSYLEHLNSIESRIENTEELKFRNSIIKYFFVADFVTAWTMGFLVFLVILFSILLAAKLQLICCDSQNNIYYPQLKRYIFSLLIVYITLVSYVLYIANNLRADDWEIESRNGWLRFFAILLLFQAIFLGYFSWPFSYVEFSGIFVVMMVFLGVYLFLLVFILVKYTPLTALVKHQRWLKPTNPIFKGQRRKKI